MNKYERAALRTANRVRNRAFGLPAVDHLYPGERNVGTNCPITNTIYDDDVNRRKFHIDTDGEAVEVRGPQDGDDRFFDLSMEAAIFVGNFDEGVYPHLEIKS